jgi:hypothetical protein
VKMNPVVEKGRIRSGFCGSNPGDLHGAFRIKGPKGDELRILASPGSEEEDVLWEHVSVSLKNRCPRWDEMCFVKDLFWDAEETVMQLHPPKSMWINNHPFCLHLFRPLNETIPLPPPISVGHATLNRD